MGSLRLVIGSRGSDLALWQARHVQGLLLERFTGGDFPIIVIKTEGDRIQDRALHQVGDGKGFFTKELEEALLARRIDLAVHSLKDLPTISPDGLVLAAVPAREEPYDVWVAHDRSGFLEAKPGARVGTASLRRKAQLRARRPDLEYVDLRGNVPTRIQRVQNGDFDAIVLAKAGLQRLGLLPAHAQVLSFEWLLPAPAQGALGLQSRADDDVTRSTLQTLEDHDARLAITAERAFLRRLEGGCQVPIGAHARWQSGASDPDAPRPLLLEGMVAALDGSRVLRGTQVVQIPPGALGAIGAEHLARAESAGIQLAEELRTQGADEILKQVRASLGP